MATTTANRLNLVVDEKLKEILAYFRAKYPLLKDVDVIKMAVSGFYVNEINNLPIQNLTEQEDQSLKKSLQSKTKNQPVFGNITDLVKHLDD